MTDVAAMTDRVFSVSRAHREAAATILNHAHDMRMQGSITNAEFDQVHDQYMKTVAAAADMLVDLDDALAALLDDPLKKVETATSNLEQAEARIAQVTAIVDVAIKVAAAAVVVVTFFLNPSVAAATTAAGAIEGVVGAIP